MQLNLLNWPRAQLFCIVMNKFLSILLLAAAIIPISLLAINLPSTEIDYPGCNDNNACNYDPQATSNNGTCLYIGDPCPDADPCTFNSAIDANCDCVGEPVICEPQNACFTASCDPLTGSCINTPIVCDDGDPCTDDICDPASGCIYVPKLDTDGDGICDAEDNCPNIPGQIGDACPNADACTLTSAIDANCNCVATQFVVCDDGDPCTLDFCNPALGCVSQAGLDSDNDGICDALDNCPNTPGEIGDACPNADACTLTSAIDANCNCVATQFVSCDDGDPCTLDYCHPTFGCISQVILADADGDGICDAGDNCPNTPGQIGSPCDDGNHCTYNDTVDANCNCVGELAECLPPNSCTTAACDPNTGLCIVTPLPDSDNDGICDAEDNCPNIPGQIGETCDDGNACTYESIIDANCNCVSTGTVICDDGDPCTDDFCDPLTGCYFVPSAIDSDNDGICDAGDNCPNTPGQMGEPCDDGNPYTGTDTVGLDCVCAGIPLDSDGDGLSDQDEVEVYFTDPFQDDTDSDGLSDWAEVFQSLTDPTDPDTDDDGCSDLLEYANLCPDSPPCCEPACVGDVNLDGFINTADLNGLLSVYGQSCP